MAKNKITDLNDHLFAQLERLGDEDVKGDELDTEVARAKAISGIAGQIIKANKLTLDAMKLIANGSVGKNDMPDNFGIKQIG